MPVCLKCGWEIVYGPGGCACTQRARREREAKEAKEAGERLVAMILEKYPNFGKEQPVSDHVCSSPERTPEQKAADEKYLAEHCAAARPSFTVITNAIGTDGRAYESRFDADRLEVVFRDGDMAPMLSFVSSGRRVLVEAAKVKGVEWSNIGVWEHDGKKSWSGAQHCAGCDGRLTHIVKRPGVA